MPTNKYTIHAETKGFKKAEGQTKRLGSSMEGLAGKVGLVAGAYFAGKGLVNAFQFATKVGKEFEQSMANLKAISGATGSEMLKLSANARQLGASTKFTASQVGELSVNYAKLGFSASQILKVSEATLNLASATGEDLATSASVAGGTLRGFGLEAEKTGMLTDVMAKSFSTSALDLTKFSESMKFVAPVAKVAGFSMQETTAILGQMANSSIDGSMAGTSLKNVLTQMTVPGSNLSKVFGKTVNNFDEFVAVLQETKKQGGLTKTQLGMIPKLLQATIPVLIDSSDKMMDYKESLDNAGGSAERMAEIQMATLEGKMLTLNSATEGLGISFFDTFDDVLKGAVDGVTSLVSSLDSWIAVPTAQKIMEEQTNLNALIGVLKNYNEDSEMRNDIIDEIQGNYGEYLGNLDLEKASYKDIETALADANLEFERRIELSAKSRILQDSAEKIIGIRVRLLEAELALQQAEKDGSILRIQFSGDGEIIFGSHTKAVEILTEKLQNAKNEYKDLNNSLSETPEEPFGMMNPDLDDTPSPLLDKTDEIATLTEFADIEALIYDQKMEQIADQKEKYLDMKVSEVAVTEWASQQEKKLDAQVLAGKMKYFSNLAGALSSLAGQHKQGALVAKRLAQAQAVIDTYAGMNKALASAPPPWNYIAMATVFATGLANVAKIESTKMALGGLIGGASHSGGGVNINAEGGEFIMSRDAVNRIGVDALSNMNEGGGGGITLNISAPLIDDTIIDTIVPAIDRARREGLA